MTRFRTTTRPRPSMLLSLAVMILSCTTSDSGPPPPDTSAGSLTTEHARVDSGAPVLLPLDEADSSFGAFRERTVAALARKDSAYLTSILAPGIRVSFGEDNGVDAFRRKWLADPDSDVWRILDRVLSLGGRMTGDSTFTAPYVFAFWPDSLDGFEHVAVVSDAAIVRAGAGPADSVLGIASRTVLRLRDIVPILAAPQPADTTAVHVMLPGDRSGWIRMQDVYSPVSWRAAFARRDGRWAMIFFVAGD